MTALLKFSTSFSIPINDLFVSIHAIAELQLPLNKSKTVSYSFELFAICALGVGGLYNRGSLIKDFRALTHFTTHMHGLIMLNQFMNKIYQSYGNNQDKYYNIVNSIMRFNDAATRYNGYDILGKNLAEITGLSHRATNSNDTLSYLSKRMFPGPDSVYSINENRINLFTGTTLLCDKIYKVIL